MTKVKEHTEKHKETPLMMARKQRSHLLLVLSNALSNEDNAFLSWYETDYRQAIVDHDNVLSVQHFEKHEIDITAGHYPPPNYKYLGVYDLSLDGAEEANDLMNFIADAHCAGNRAETPAIWLYYPISERVGEPFKIKSQKLILAFATAISGYEDKFREWYCSQHIRHALNIPVLVSGQCFEKTGFQCSKSIAAVSNLLALYEQDGSPQEFLKQVKSLPKKTLEFPPIVDDSCFSEGVYQPLS